MAAEKDLEAFLDFLQERGVPVLQIQRGLANYPSAATAAVNTTTAGDGSELAAATAAAEDAQQVAKKAVVSAFLQHVNGFARKAAAVL